MERVEKLPGGRWVLRHPRVAGWIVLAVGMVALLIIEARDVGLLAGQWLALIVATVLVAGLCIWIVSWDDNNEADAEGQPPEVVTDPAETATPVITDETTEQNV
jgi:hypothetical protein